MFRRILRPVVGVLVAGAALAAPGAASAQIDGDTLDVFADGLGRLQIIPTGQSAGLFFPPASGAPDAGIEASVNGVAVPLGTGRAAVSAPTLTTLPFGAVSLDSVYTLDADGGGPDLQVTEQLGYVNGAPLVTGIYTIQNLLGTALPNVRIGAVARVAEPGVGQLDSAPPRRLFSNGSTTGLRTALVEDTPWTAFQEGPSANVFANFRTATLSSTVDSRSVDSGIGAEWNLGTMEPGQASQITFGWYIERGAPALQPDLGKSVLAVTSKGKVRVKLPGSNRFVDLTSLRELPLGTTFDTTKGQVTLTSAADAAGATQKAWFYEGIFKIGQTKGPKPLTTLAMAGTKPSCGKARSSKKKAKSRRLWGDGAGRFQTKGQFSSATVRGTKWLVQDRCDGTLTKVVRGSVTVRDFVKDKNVIVKAGRSYLARKPG